MVGGDRAHRQQEQREEADRRVERRHDDDIPDDGDQDEADDVDAPIREPPGRVRHHKGDQEGQDPDGHGQQQGLDVAVAERLQDGREEVLEGLGEQRAVLQQREQVQPRVPQREHDALLHGRGVGLVGLARVLDEPPARVRALLGRQPGGRRRVVGQDEDGAYGAEDGEAAFDDEEPAPVFCYYYQTRYLGLDTGECEK